LIIALEPNPQDRFESAFELREALAYPSSVVSRTRAGPAHTGPWWWRPVSIGFGLLAVSSVIVCAVSQRY
jgi:hypothetical protein